MRHRKRLRTPVIVKKRRRVVLYRIIGVIVLCVLVFLGLVFGSRSHALSINTVHITGNESIATSTILSVVDPHLKGFYAGLFSKKNTFLYPKEAILKDLTNTFLKIQSVEINRNGFHTINISIQERSPLFWWCGETQSTTELLATSTSVASTTPQEEHCYSVGQTGLLFAEVPANVLASSTKVRLYGPLLDAHQASQATGTLMKAQTLQKPVQMKARTLLKNPVIGRDFLKAKPFENTAQILEALRQNGFVPVSVDSLGNGTVNVMLQNGWQLKFLTTENPLQLIKNLQDFLASDVFNGDGGKKKREDIDYIDLRFGNKVFYKEKGDTEE